MDDSLSRMPRVTLQRLGLAVSVLVLLNFFLSLQDVVKVEIRHERFFCVLLRCNLAQTLPYVHDVGIKHGLTTMNPSVMAHDYRFLDQNSTVKAKFVDRLRQLGDSIFYQFAFVNKNGRDYIQWTNEIIVNESLPVKSVFPPRTCNGMIRKVWSRTREFQFKRPSSGMYMITVAITICDEIHVYGYFPFKEDHRGTRLRYHYYDHRRYSTGGLHAMPEEYRALRMLHDRGVLRLHNDRCRP